MSGQLLKSSKKEFEKIKDILIKGNYIFPIDEYTGNISWSVFAFYIFLAILIILFVLIIMQYSLNEYIKKLGRNCKEKEKDGKCGINKKCIYEEIALGKELKEAIDKCLK
tara:strand:- start:7474 stop:7803 length:330 start_codon:yes stop_codon:yes gene_type:complete